MAPFPFQATSTLPLAQGDGSDYGSIALWIGILIVLLVVLFLAVNWLRRKLKEPEPSAVAPAGFTLGDLRDMHRAGQLTDEEYEKAKGKIVAASQRAAQREAERLANGRGARTPAGPDR